MPPQRNLSDERKAAYYIGMVISVIGLLLFLSNFVIFAVHFGAPDLGPGFGRGFALRGFGGFMLIVAGQVLRGLGARGLAGSGVILDPQRERKDLEPWSRMAGGMVSDALSEVDSLDSLKKPAAPAVKVRCLKCHALNDEAAKFCNQCGAAL
jgi:hypothetical protein